MQCKRVHEPLPLTEELLALLAAIEGTAYFILTLQLLVGKTSSKG